MYRMCLYLQYCQQNGHKQCNVRWQIKSMAMKYDTVNSKRSVVRGAGRT
jgi:hypothetical protein